MTELLNVPVKKSSEVDMVKPLRNLIQSTYSASSSGEGGGEATQNYAEAVSEFNKLRNTAIWKFFEKYESSLEIVYGWVQCSDPEGSLPSVDDD